MIHQSISVPLFQDLDGSINRTEKEALMRFEIKRDYVFSDGDSGSGGGGRLAVVEVMAVVETDAVVVVK